MKIKTIAILPLLALSLAAGEDRPFGLEASSSLVIASQDMNKLTDGGNLAGYTLGLGLRSQIKPGLNHRLHVDLMSFRGGRQTGLEGASPKHMLFGWDILQDLGKWTVFGGLMGVKWKQDIKSDTLAVYQGLRGEAKGVKFGARIGAEYAITPNWHSTISYNQSEFNRNLNPGWWGVGLTYRFGGTSKAAPVVAPVPAPIPAPAPEPKPEPKPEPVMAPPPPPPAPEPVKEVAKPVPPPPPAKIVLDEAVLHFANGKAELGADAITAIQKVADGLKAYNGSYTLEVSGHTSSVGGKALNKTLAKRRADAVAKVLVDAGIPADKVTTMGVGPDKPIADNATKEGQSKNRRVEIDVKVNDGKIEVRKTETGVVDAAAPAPAPKKPAKKAVK